MEQTGSTRRLANLANQLGRIIELASGTLCVLLCAGMFAVTILGVFFRYVMISPFEWTEEMARFLMLALGFLAINIAVRRDEHIKINLVVNCLPTTISRWLDYLVDAFVAFFLIFLLIKGYSMAFGTMMTAGTVDMSMFWPYLTVPLGAFLSLLQLILRLARKVYSGPEEVGAEV